MKLLTWLLLLALLSTPALAENISVTPAGAPLVSPTFTGTMTAPTIAGGSATNSALSLESTSNGSPSGDEILLNGSTLKYQTIGGTDIFDYAITTPATLTIEPATVFQNQASATSTLSRPGFISTTSVSNSIALTEHLSGRPELLLTSGLNTGLIDMTGSTLEVVGVPGAITFAPNSATALTMQADGGTSLGTAGDPGGKGILGLQAYTIGTLPSCSLTNEGALSYVTNGVTSPTFLGSVSTTGTTVAPVFCNGSSWVYG